MALDNLPIFEVTHEKFKIMKTHYHLNSNSEKRNGIKQ